MLTLMVSLAGLCIIVCILYGIVTVIHNYVCVQLQKRWAEDPGNLVWIGNLDKRTVQNSWRDWRPNSK
jgi:hypothetical protein